MLGLDTPSASASSPSVSGPREFSDPSAAMTDTECSPSVSRLRRRTIRMSATRRLPATSAGVPMVAENWLGILISLHNQGDAGHIGWRKWRAHDQQQDRGRDLRPGDRRVIVRPPVSVPATLLRYPWVILTASQKIPSVSRSNSGEISRDATIAAREPMRRP